MAKRRAWREFELLIKRIHDELEPRGVVRHNHKIRGRSGRKRQIDVSITRTIGLTKVLVAIECKRWKRPVGIERVEAFASKLRDVGASDGVIISPSGFQEGARSSAMDNRITLLTYRDARDADWKRLLGEKAWAPLD